MAKAASVLSLPRLPTAVKSAASPKRYKGVRQRKWGRWVSEIRIVKPRDKIWLGSYSSPEKAARAFDAALILRGSSSKLNFPNSLPNLDAPTCPPSREAIQAAAFAAANADDFPETPHIVADEDLRQSCYLDETAESLEMPQIVPDEELQNCYDVDKTAESLEVPQFVADEELHKCYHDETAESLQMPEIVTDQELLNCYIDELAEFLQMPHTVADEELRQNCYLDRTAERRPAEQGSTQLRPEGVAHADCATWKLADAKAQSDINLLSLHDFRNISLPMSSNNNLCEGQHVILSIRQFDKHKLQNLMMDDSKCILFSFVLDHHFCKDSHDHRIATAW